MSDEKEEDRRYFRTFGVFLVIEAVLAILVISPQSTSMPWWLPGLLVITPPGWILPWLASYLYLKAFGPGSDGPAAAGPARDAPPRSHGHARLPADWASALAAQGYNLDRLYSEVDDLYSATFGRVVPHRHLLFRAFHLTPLHEVNVVIVGQDPYPRLASADGLAFSQKGPVEPRSSLPRIFESLARDPAILARVPEDGDLTPWAERGVLLLNRALTVQEGFAGSHLREWQEFSQRVLRVLDIQRPATIYLCMGRAAADAVIAIKGSRARGDTIIVTAHPMARDLDESDLPRFQTARPFSQVNDRLAAKGVAQIRWGL